MIYGVWWNSGSSQSSLVRSTPGGIVCHLRGWRSQSAQGRDGAWPVRESECRNPSEIELALAILGATGFLYYLMICLTERGLPQWLSGKESACHAGASGDTGLIPGSGRSPGGGNGSVLQHPCLENPMDRGAWRATVHRVSKSWTWLKQPSMHSRMLTVRTQFYRSLFWWSFVFTHYLLSICSVSWEIQNKRSSDQCNSL